MAYFNETDEVKCPYCGERQGLSYWYPDQDELRAFDCDDCGNEFTLSASYSLTLTSQCGGREENACDWVENWIGDDLSVTERDGKKHVYAECIRCGETAFIDREKVRPLKTL